MAAGNQSREVVRVGTRGSRLALIQTDLTLAALSRTHPDIRFEVITVTTQGDANRNAPLAGMGLGVFVKEIERRLETGEIDMAVHSLKDMPTALPDGMVIGAVLERADPRDVLVSHLGSTLAKFPAGLRIGTSSPRRAAQIAEQRPDLEIVPIRGNVDTRLRKAAGDECDGTILAAAGLIRMGLEDVITEFLAPEQFVPPPGQGAMAVEIRADDDWMTQVLSSISHVETTAAVTAERSFLEQLGGGCQVPVGAYASIPDASDILHLNAFIGSPDGSIAYRATSSTRLDSPADAAETAWESLRQQGAASLLAG